MKWGTLRYFVIGCVSALSLSGQVHAIDGRHVNGVTVFCQWFSPFYVSNPYACENRTPRGPILRGDIVNNQVVGWDTLFAGLGQYPAISSDGTKVAFFRWGYDISYDASTGRATPSGSANPSYLAVVNMDGSGLTNLIPLTMETDCEWQGEGNDVLDWPAGNWVYYEKPRKTGEIYRINVLDPSQNVFVTNINGSTMARRWSLSLDGNAQGAQGGPCGNCVAAFPWDGRSVGAPGCNMTISSGGTILAHYFGGCHDDVDIVDFGPYNWQTPNPWTFTKLVWINEIESQLGYQVSYSNCADLLRWAVNSDKWVLRQIGWCGQGMDIAKGANQVLVNWVDDVAILGNPRLPPPEDCQNAPSPRGQWVNACAGDFYITGDVNNPNSVAPNTYEDQNGVWRTVGAPPDPVTTMGLAPSSLEFSASEGGSDPSDQQVDVTNPGVGTLNTVTTSVSYQQGSSWLSVARAGDGNTQTLTNSVSIAGLSSGTYGATVTVTATNSNPPSKSYDVVLTVLSPSLFDAVVIGPSVANVLPSGTQQFTATAVDQYGDALASQPTFTWSISDGQNLSAGGLFTAGGSEGGPYTVTAATTVGGTEKSGTAQVSVRSNMPGLVYEYYERNGLASVPNFDALSPTSTGTVGNFDISVATRGDDYAIRFTGVIEVPADGDYTFYTSSDDGSVLWIGATMVVDNDGVHGAQEASGTVTLAAGMHPITVGYFQGCCGLELAVSWESGSIAKQQIPDSRLYHLPNSTHRGSRGVFGPSWITNLLTVRAGESGYVLQVKVEGAHTVDIMDASGTTVKRLEGVRPTRYAVVRGSFTPGVYMLRVRALGKEELKRIMVW